MAGQTVESVRVLCKHVTGCVGAQAAAGRESVLLLLLVATAAIASVRVHSEGRDVTNAGARVHVTAVGHEQLGSGGRGRIVCIRRSVIGKVGKVGRLSVRRRLVILTTTADADAATTGGRWQRR